MKSYRIPNLLNLLGCVIGITYAVWTGGGRGILTSVKGMLIPVGLLFVFFCFRILGAGDIKLLAAIGSFAGMDILEVMMIAFILAAVFGIFKTALKLYQRIKQMKGEEKEPYTVSKMHFSVPILIGTLFYALGGI